MDNNNPISLQSLAEKVMSMREAAKPGNRQNYLSMVLNDIDSIMDFMEQNPELCEAPAVAGQEANALAFVLWLGKNTFQDEDGNRIIHGSRELLTDKQLYEHFNPSGSLPPADYEQTDDQAVAAAKALGILRPPALAYFVDGWNSKPAGPVWVKASDRHGPLEKFLSVKDSKESGGLYRAGNFFEDENGTVSFAVTGNDCYRAFNIPQVHFDKLFWLDESPAQVFTREDVLKILYAWDDRMAEQFLPAIDTMEWFNTNYPTKE